MTIIKFRNHIFIFGLYARSYILFRCVCALQAKTYQLFGVKLCDASSQMFGQTIVYLFRKCR